MEAIRSCESSVLTVLPWLVTANVVPSSLILFNLMTAIRSSETSVITSNKASHPRNGHSSRMSCDSA
jgi:hypothetical protein